MAENTFKGTVEALFHGLDGVVSSKTVVGEARIPPFFRCGGGVNKYEKICRQLYIFFFIRKFGGLTKNICS